MTGMASRFVKKIKNKFRGAIGLSVPAAILLSACAPLTVDQMPAREQRDFLRDIKKIVDANDLSDVPSVSRWLRVDFVVESEGDVYINEGAVRLGYDVTLRVVSSGKEYRKGRGEMDYSMLLPSDGSPRRTRVGVSINTGVICVSSKDLIDVFGAGRRYPRSHGDGWDYLYLAQEGGLSRILDFIEMDVFLELGFAREIWRGEEYAGCGKCAVIDL
ncbi:hypothetical protein [Burkholderia ubonensis]|uniref:hypothetical protein n=1 Tax=Burkholderia ubonensis TaxID=101571 RepID=UPI0012FA4CBB|nr:hypothetical protein [Burkholderia ubonensis]